MRFSANAGKPGLLYFSLNNLASTAPVWRHLPTFNAVLLLIKRVGVGQLRSQRKPLQCPNFCQPAFPTTKRLLYP